MASEAVVHTSSRSEIFVKPRIIMAHGVQRKTYAAIEMMTEPSYLDLLPLSTDEMAKFYGGLSNLVTMCCGCNATMYAPGEWTCNACGNRLFLAQMDWFSRLEEEIQRETDYQIQCKNWMGMY